MVGKNVAVLFAVVVVVFVGVLGFAIYNYLAIAGKYNELSVECGTLRSDYDALKRDYDALYSKYEELLEEHNRVVNEYNRLVSKYNKLVDEYNQLLDEYYFLKEYAKEPPYTVVYGRNVTFAFWYKDTVKLWIWDMDSYKAYVYLSYLIETLPPSELARMAKNIEDEYLKSIINKFITSDRYLLLKNSKTGETYYVMNFAPYVTPELFEKVIPELYYESGSDENFIRAVWSIATQLTMYAEEIEETPRFPAETLVEGGGDCEDLAILVASMIKAAPADYKVQLVYMDLDHPTDPQDVNHVAVWVEAPSGYKTFVEATSKTEMSPYDAVVGWFIDV